MKIFLDFSKDEYHSFFFTAPSCTYIEVDVDETNIAIVLKTSLDQVKGVFVFFEKEAEFDFKECSRHHIYSGDSFVFFNQSIRNRLIKNDLNKKEQNLFQSLIKRLG